MTADIDTNTHSTQRAGTDAHAITFTVALAVLGVFVTHVPINAVSVALAQIGASTAASTSDLQWISDGFVIPVAAAVLSAGLFGDLYGRRRIFLSGMAFILVGATVAALSDAASGDDAIHILWFGQALSGLGAGLLLPTTLALIAHVVPNPAKRGKYIGIWATGLLLGLAVGPLISGVILDHASYGWIFAPTIGLAAIAGVTAAARLPESKAPDGRRLDWPGQFTGTLAIAASIFGVIEGGEKGWSSAATVTGLIVGGAAFVAFVAVELRSPSPVVDLRLFRSAVFAAAGAAAMVALFSVVGATFLLSLFLANVQHLSALQIGLRLLLIFGVAAAINPVIGLLLSRAKPIYVLAIGLALSAVGIFLLRAVEADTSTLDLGWRLGVFGIAVGLILTTVSVTAVNAVPWQLAGMAAATNTAMRQYGAALGPAVLGAIYVDRINGDASPTSAIHAALLVNGILLTAAAIGCLLVAIRSKFRSQSSGVIVLIDAW